MVWVNEFNDGRSWGRAQNSEPLRLSNPPLVRVRALAFRADGTAGFMVAGRVATVGEVATVEPSMADTLVSVGKAERV